MVNQIEVQHSEDKQKSSKFVVENRIENDDLAIWADLIAKFKECSASAKSDTLMLQNMLQPNVQNSPVSLIFPTCIEPQGDDVFPMDRGKSEEQKTVTPFPDLGSHPLFSRNHK